MICPRCTSEMLELDRDGITIDRCGSCRGVFLDRGELEKLLTRNPGNTDRRERERDDDDDDDDRGRHRGRRSSWWEIFD